MQRLGIRNEFADFSLQSIFGEGDSSAKKLKRKALIFLKNQNK
jgi:hypothetical protein